MIQAIVFDMDGLIFDSERIVQRSWEAAGKQLHIEHMGDHIYNTIGFNLKRRNAYFCSAISPDFPVEEFAQRARETFREIADKEGVPVKTGAQELLAYAASQGYKLALATSSRRAYSEEMLQDAGLYGYFDGFVYGDMVQNAKPDPEIYVKACETIGVLPKHSIALEDSPAGIQSAYAAGLAPIMVPDLVEPTEEIVKLVYRKYTTLLEVIELLKGGN